MSILTHHRSCPGRVLLRPAGCRFRTPTERALGLLHARFEEVEYRHSTSGLWVLEVSRPVHGDSRGEVCTFTAATPAGCVHGMCQNLGLILPTTGEGV